MNQSRRWWLPALAGAVLGLVLQLVWISNHGWAQAHWRLPAGLLGGSLALLGAAWLWWWRKRLAGWLLVLSGLDSAGGRRVWLALMLLALLAGAHFAYHDWLVPRLGREKVRQYFRAHAQRDKQGLLALFYPSLDQADSPRVLGLARAWYFPDVPHFPGGKQAQYVLRWLGVIRVPVSGRYGFGGYVDDGLIVLVDGVEVARDYREHGKRLAWGWIDLAAGEHALEIRYRQVWEGAFLEVLWQPPGGRRGPLDPSLLYPLRPDTDLVQVLRLRLAHGLVYRPWSNWNPLMGGRFWRLPW